MRNYHSSEGVTIKILLVQPELNQPIPWAQSPSTALLTLGTLAKQRGHEVKIFHTEIDGDVGKAIRSFKPDILGITCNTFQVRSARIIAKLGRNYGARVIIGGPHACVWEGKEEVVVGEGENEWLKILGEEPNIKSMNDLPPLDYDLIDFSKFSGVLPVGAYPSTAIMASRGCPYECTFCNTPVFWGKKIRRRTPESVITEVKLLHEKYGMNELLFQDDTFNLDHKWAGEIFEGLIREKLSDEMLFRICCRVNERLITKEFLELASKAGVWNIFLGVESGSQEMLDRMHKGITIAEVLRAAKMAHEAHINTQCSFIVGMPGETRKTLQDTSELISRLSPTNYGWAKACPFPKTKFREEVIAKGHILDMDYSEYGYGITIVRTDKLSFEELQGFGGFKFDQIHVATDWPKIRPD